MLRTFLIQLIQRHLEGRKKAIAEILGGYIEPSPLKKMSDKQSGECEYCEFAGFCGKESARFGQGRNYVSGLDVSSFNNEGAENGN